MVDRLLRVHIQSQRAFGPRWTLSYNMGNLRIASRAVTGMGEVGWDDVPHCEVCPLAKQSQEHFPKSESRATRPMEPVHTDVMGPFLVLGMNDDKYVVTLMDDHSRYREVICPRGKNHAFTHPLLTFAFLLTARYASRACDQLLYVFWLNLMTVSLSAPLLTTSVIMSPARTVQF